MIVPDSPKAMIADVNRYEPRNNDTVIDFACRYGTSILPARPQHPRIKPRRNRRSRSSSAGSWRAYAISIASTREVNVAIAPLLTRLNDKLFQKLPGSRASTFLEIDAPALLCRCRCRTMRWPISRPSRCTSTITSMSSAIATACRSPWSARCWRHATRQR